MRRLVTSISLLLGLLFLAGWMPQHAGAETLLEASQARLRVDGVDAGTGAFGGGGEVGWRGSNPGDTEAGAEFLYFDLAQTPIDPTQGAITATFVRGDFQQDEGVVTFADENWKEMLSISCFWDAPGEEKVMINQHGVVVVHNAHFPIPATPRKGEPFQLVFSWNEEDFRIGFNGREFQTDAKKDMEALVGAFRATRYVVVGAELEERFPRGAYSQIVSRLTAFRLTDNYADFGATLFLENIAPDKRAYGGGQEIVASLRGSVDRTATFTVGDVAVDVPMTEIDDGVYVGRTTVPAGLNFPAAALTGTLSDPASGETVTASGGTLTIDGVAPDAVPRLLASVPWAGEIEVAWDASPAADLAEYRVYRGEGADPVTTGAAYETTRELKFTDTAIIPGIQYRYAVVPVDAAGNPGAPSDIVTATAVAGDGPTVSGITIEPFGRPAKPGAVLALTLTGQSGGTATLDLGELATGIALTEAGRTGVYTGTYTVADADVAASKTSHRLVAHLSDDFGATDQAGPELLVVGLDALNDHTQPTIAGASHDGFQVAGFSGALVPGDLLSVSLEGEPLGYASFAIDGVTAGVAMGETPEGSGTYRGTYTVDWDDAGVAVPLTATLADEAGNATPTAVGRPLVFDTRVRLSVTARDTLLPADRESQTRLVVQAEDANGGKVSGHELSLMLSTTEEYTGVVGGGDVEGSKASKDDEDDLEVKWGGTTDFSGEVAATYTAGFAAKTALIVVKDLTTGDVGAGWLNTYVASTVSINLTPVAGRAARGIADQAVLTLTADPTWLTADGRSKSRLTATLRSLTGAPIEGARISFALAGDNGKLKIFDTRTDARGVAEAEYRAGTLIGSVSVTAASSDYGVAAAVQITLMSDAPAKIDLVASAVSLPADGSSTAQVTFRVTDINDNPNAAVPVSLALKGSGKLSVGELLTDPNGEGAATYTAGRDANTTVEIEARHTSRAPTQEELQRIYGTVFVPRLLDRQERERIKVTEWLAEPGDEVVKGQPLVVLEMREASWTLTAPATGIFVRQIRHRRDRVELGDTLGYVEIDSEVWDAEYGR